jgi:hypothetical protein
MNTKLDLITAQLRLQHPDWSFERVFTEAVEASGQTGSFGHDSVDKGIKLVAPAKDSGSEIKPSSPSAPPLPAARPKLMLVRGSDYGMRYPIFR